jgi:hypothetical protein
MNSEKPIIAFKGVRNSCDMLARKRDFSALALQASSRADVNSSANLMELKYAWRARRYCICPKPTIGTVTQIVAISVTRLVAMASWIRPLIRSSDTMPTWQTAIGITIAETVTAFGKRSRNSIEIASNSQIILCFNRNKLNISSAPD